LTAAAQRADGQNCPSPALTRTEAARLAAVSARTLDDAKVVLANGTPAEVAAVTVVPAPPVSCAATGYEKGRRRG
jgi:hypothetical protein